MSNGYGSAMRVCTKILKVSFGYLREAKFTTNFVYVDNLFLQGETYQFCLANILDTINY